MKMNINLEEKLFVYESNIVAENLLNKQKTRQLKTIMSLG